MGCPEVLRLGGEIPRETMKANVGGLVMAESFVVSSAEEEVAVPSKGYGRIAIYGIPKVISFLADGPVSEIASH